MKTILIYVLLTSQSYAFADPLDAYKAVCEKVGTFRLFTKNGSTGACSLEATSISWMGGISPGPSEGKVVPFEKIEELKKICPGETWLGAGLPDVMILGSGGHVASKLTVWCYL